MIKIEYITANSQEHINGILELQQKNLPQNLSKEQQQKQGFVFAKHSVNVLEKMIALEPQFIAVRDNKVVGYNLSMPKETVVFIPELAPIFIEFDRIQFEGKAISAYRYIVGGQVCVDYDCRGNGVANQLYGNMKTELTGKYEICVTAISERNTISLNAHAKRGFQVAGKFDDGNEPWNIVVWKF